MNSMARQPTRMVLSQGQSAFKAIEKSRLAWLACLTVALPLVLSKWSSHTSFQTLILLYGSVYVSLRLIAKKHNKQITLPMNKAASFNQGYTPKVSILIPAHNEASVIAKTVQQVLNIDYPDFELLVINDHSTDDTEVELQRVQENIQYCFNVMTRKGQAITGKAAALNDAMNQVQGEILCILDADAVVQPDFLKKLVPYFSDASVGAVQPQKQLLNPTQSLLTRCQQYEYNLDAHFQASRNQVQSAVELRGNGMLIRRSTLETLGGWNENSLTEDLDFCTRMHITGRDLRYVPDVHIWEEAVPQFMAFFRQRLRWTEGSVIRYLENAETILFNPQVTFRAKLDMVQFLFEFLIPIWLLVDNVLLFYKLFISHSNELFVSFAVPAMLVLTLYFLWATYKGITTFSTASPKQALGGTLLTYFYLSFIWVPLVFIVLYRILGKSTRNLVWDKTPRYGGLTQ